MRVIRLAGSELVEERMPQPHAGRGEVLIRVYAAGLTPSELEWSPTTHNKAGGVRTGAVPGHEFSGVVAAVGDGVTGFVVGQDVFGMNDWYAEGAMAEYCVAPASSIAPKPRGLTHVAAASVPISALTAWQGLYDRAQIQAGERVLVHGGAGAVGVYAIQLARLSEAHVTATVSAANLKFVTQLGAEVAIDYRAEKFEGQARDMDVVFDTVGGETLERSWGVLRPGGRMVTIAAGEERSADERAKRAFFIVEPNAQVLGEIGRLIEAERLQTVVDAVVPFAEAAAAYTGHVLGRRGHGKTVVAMDALGASAA